MKTSLTVFLCSTYSDLVAEREGVLSAIRALQLQHDSMEFFGARADQPIETCLAEVRRSDMLVVIVGHRYGSLVPDHDMSFAEAEYAEGFVLGKPCLVYLRDENVPILPKFMERDPEKLRLLEKFRARLTSRHTAATFQNENDLAVQVTADLSRTVQALEQSKQAEKERQPRSPDSVIQELDKLVRTAMDGGISDAAIISAVRRTLATLGRGQTEKKPIVFLSYSHKDKPVVREVATGLQERGVDVWYDEMEIQLGDRLVERIQFGLDSADFLAFFLSKNSTRSAWAQRELSAIMTRRLDSTGGPVILPIVLDDAEVPALLRDVHYLDLRDRNIEKCVESLSDAITAIHRNKNS